jgi:hypothetical protein
MVAVNPIYAQSHDATQYNTSDGAAVADYLTLLTDDNLTTPSFLAGKGPDDILRLNYPGKLGLAVGNTFSFHYTATHSYGSATLMPYSGALSVNDPNKIVVAPSGSPIVFTLTFGFINNLFDQGGGVFSVRFTENSVSFPTNGYVTMTEVDADLTVPIPRTHQMIL